MPVRFELEYASDVTAFVWAREQLWLLTGKEALCIGRDGEVRLRKSTKTLAMLYGHTRLDAVDRVFAQTSTEKKLQVLDTSKGLKKLGTLAGPNKKQVRATVSQDGRRIVSHSLDRYVMVWDTETHALLSHWQGPEAEGLSNPDQGCEVFPLDPSANRVLVRHDEHCPVRLSIYEVDTEAPLREEAGDWDVTVIDGSVYIHGELDGETIIRKVDGDEASFETVEQLPAPTDTTAASTWPWIPSIVRISRGSSQAFAGPFEKVANVTCTPGCDTVLVVADQHATWLSLEEALGTAGTEVVFFNPELAARTRLRVKKLLTSQGIDMAACAKGNTYRVPRGPIAEQLRTLLAESPGTVEVGESAARTRRGMRLADKCPTLTAWHGPKLAED